MSAIGGKADIGATLPQCPLMTQIGHWQSEFAVTHNFTDAGEVARPLPRLCAPQDT